MPNVELQLDNRNIGEFVYEGSNIVFNWFGDSIEVPNWKDDYQFYVFNAYATTYKDGTPQSTRTGLYPLVNLGNNCYLGVGANVYYNTANEYIDSKGYVACFSMENGVFSTYGDVLNDLDMFSSQDNAVYYGDAAYINVIQEYVDINKSQYVTQLQSVIPNMFRDIRPNLARGEVVWMEGNPITTGYFRTAEICTNKPYVLVQDSTAYRNLRIVCQDGDIQELSYASNRWRWAPTVQYRLWNGQVDSYKEHTSPSDVMVIGQTTRYGAFTLLGSPVPIFDSVEHARAYLNSGGTAVYGLLYAPTELRKQTLLTNYGVLGHTIVNDADVFYFGMNFSLPNFHIPLGFDSLDPNTRYDWRAIKLQYLINGQVVPVGIQNVNITEGDSEAGGGHGGFDQSSDEISFSVAPNIDATGTGLVSLYAPTTTQLNSLASYLWSDDFLDNLSKMWSDPNQLIVSLGIMPIQPEQAHNAEVHMGGFSTGVTLRKVDKQITSFDFGVLNMNEFFGTALDYAPYTQVSLYLPFIGTVNIDGDMIMDGSIHVKYLIDLLSGGFVAQVKVTNSKSGTDLDSVIYHYQGSMLQQIPITSATFGNIVAGLTSAGYTISSMASGDMIGTAVGFLGTVGSLTGQKVTHGSIGGQVGILDTLTPYVIIERPVQSLPSNYGHLEGYPSNITAQLSTVSGYTEIEAVIANTLSCPEMEQMEIVELLKGGVYL